LLFVNRKPRSAIIIPCLIFVGGILLRAFLACQHPAADVGVSFRGFQAWIYYPTWTRLDPLVFGVALAAIEKFRPQWWTRLMEFAIWLWLPALGLIVYALWLGEGDYLSIAAAVWQFPLVAFGFTGLLVCALSPRMMFCRIKIPGVAFIASIAYSAYLVQKLVIHAVARLCLDHGIALDSALALIGVELCVYITATILFLAIEWPFLQLRHKIAPWPGRTLT
jgi:peptidoglycan/LPS O-acetylase OafA/YrhL